MGAAATADAATGEGKGKSKGKGKGKGKAQRPKTDGPTGPDLEREVCDGLYTGEVVSFKGKWGFIKPADEIEHPDFKEVIWFAKQDFGEDVFVKRGQKVEFSLYKDTTGKLGAENI